MEAHFSIVLAVLDGCDGMLMYNDESIEIWDMF